MVGRDLAEAAREGLVGSGESGAGTESCVCRGPEPVPLSSQVSSSATWGSPREPCLPEPLALQLA